MRGRPRTPTKVLEMRGSFARNPKRRKEREHEPVVTRPIGDPPECLDEAQRARWLEIVEMCPWVNYSHRMLVEQTARLWMLDRGVASPADRKLFQSNMRLLGASPADQSKVQMPSAKDEKKSLLA